MSSPFSTTAAEALERLSQAFESLGPLIDRTDDLAFALFQTDRDVQALVDRVGEGRGTAWTVVLAWKRNELGKRAEYWDRARAALALLPRVWQPCAPHARAHDGKPHVERFRVTRVDNMTGEVEVTEDQADGSSTHRLYVSKYAQEAEAGTRSGAEKTLRDACALHGTERMKRVAAAAFGQVSAAFGQVSAAALSHDMIPGEAVIGLKRELEAAYKALELATSLSKLARKPWAQLSVPEKGDILEEMVQCGHITHHERCYLVQKIEDDAEKLAKLANNNPYVPPTEAALLRDPWNPRKRVL